MHRITYDKCIADSQIATNLYGGIPHPAVQKQRKVKRYGKMKKQQRIIKLLLVEAAFVGITAFALITFNEVTTLINFLNKQYYIPVVLVTLSALNIAFLIVFCKMIKREKAQDDEDNNSRKKLNSVLNFLIAFSFIFIFSVLAIVATVEATGSTTSETEKVYNQLIPAECFGSDVSTNTEVQTAFWFATAGGTYFETDYYDKSSSNANVCSVSGEYADNCNEAILKKYHDTAIKAEHLGMENYEIISGEADGAVYTLEVSDNSWYYVNILNGKRYLEVVINDFNKSLGGKEAVLQYCLGFMS